MTRIDKEAIKAKKEAKRAITFPRAEPEEAPEELMASFSYRKLQAIAKDLGLKTSGTKEELLRRIEEA